MTKVLIVYCTMTGNTKLAAETLADAVKAVGAQAIVKDGCEATPQDLLECDAVALGSYDAFSYMGGSLKHFFDHAFYPTQNAVTDKPYAAFVSHGGGGRAIQSIESLAQSFKLSKAADAVLFKGGPDAQAVAVLQEMGKKLVAAAKK